MKISKNQKGFAIAALLAMTFFSFYKSSMTDFEIGVTVTEKLIEVPSFGGGKESLTIRDYRFNYYNSEEVGVTLEKREKK